MRRSRDLLVVVICTVLVAALAWAASPHFLKATSAIDTDGTLTVSWKEAGLGDTSIVTYTASASADRLSDCKAAPRLLCAPISRGFNLIAVLIVSTARDKRPVWMAITPSKCQASAAAGLDFTRPAHSASASLNFPCW